MSGNLDHRWIQVNACDCSLRADSLRNQEGDIAERDLADQLLGEVVAADEDLVCCAVAEARLDARLAAHFCTVSLVL